MAILQAEIKRGFLTALARQAGAASTLNDTLTGFQDYCFSPELKRGRLITASSGNAHHTAFQMAANGFQMTQDQIFALSQEFLEVYSDSLSSLQTATPPIPTPSDAQILATMLIDDRMTSIRSYQNDYTATRFPTFGPGVN